MVQSSIARLDVWSFKPGLISLASVLVIALGCQIPGTLSMLLIPLTLLGYAIGIVTVLVVTVYFVIKKRPRRGASVLLILLLPLLLWRPINRIADLIHLGFTVHFGVWQIGVSQEGRGDEFAIYDWSVGLAGGPNTFLIHDTTDEIATPTGLHSHSLNPANSLEEECAGKVDHLVSHYYICTI